MKFWRVWAILLGLSLMVGETIRSWGQGRNPLFVLDDFFVGLPLVVTAILMARPSIPRLCAFSSSLDISENCQYICSAGL